MASAAELTDICKHGDLVHVEQLLAKGRSSLSR